MFSIISSESFFCYFNKIDLIGDISAVGQRERRRRRRREKTKILKFLILFFSSLQSRSINLNGLLFH